MKLILPDYIFGEDNELNIQCNNLQEMYKEVAAIDHSIAEKLFDETGATRKNIILVMNDKIIKKSAVDQIEFLDNAVIEVFLQFAGG